MTMHWHYFRHDPSGDAFAISVGNGGMFGDVCGPLSQDERTVENLVQENFHYDEDDQEWMGSQTWRMIAPDNPDCDCPPSLKHPGCWIENPRKLGEEVGK